MCQNKKWTKNIKAKAMEIVNSTRALNVFHVCFKCIFSKKKKKNYKFLADVISEFNQRFGMFRTSVELTVSTSKSSKD